MKENELDLKGYVSAEMVAEVCHCNQVYGKGDSVVPYIKHVGVVVRQVVELFGCHPRIQDVAWLHDVLEDGDIEVYNPENLLHYFCPTIVDAVKLLSKNYSDSYDSYIRGLLDDRDQGDGLAWKVKVADTLSNLEASVLSDEPRRINKYSRQLELLYYMEI